ncbi:ABC transporter ATP-binding protein [Sphingomonas sp.]|uniref:ABC transporter ATP-binding protein n=1 Tax=Sphingomonas sp. TaxID=28214 RepID=UPI0025D1C7DF|nr:ABC transporter ATP-binding protein [Sphingomonas sp.]
MKWLIREFLPMRRRWQALGLLFLMILGGIAEAFTLAAVFPLLSFMADPAHVGTSRIGHVIVALGINPASLSLPTLAAAFCVVAIASAAIRITLAWSSQGFAFRLAYDLGVGLYERMLYQPYSFHAGLNSSTIVATVNNIQRLLTSMFLPVMQGLSAVTLSLFIVGGLLLIKPDIALAALFGFGGIYILTSFLTKSRLRKNAKKIGVMRGMRVQAVQEGLGGIRDVLIDNSQQVYIKKFAELDETLRDAQAANALIAVTPRFVVEALGMVFIVGIAVVLNAVNGTLEGSLPVLAVLALGAQRLMPLLQQIYAAWANALSERSLFIGVVELLQLPLPQRFVGDKDIVPIPLEDTLRIENVSYRYHDDGPLVIRNVDLTIKRGSWTGLLGKSGSGKSTLMDLVMGLLRPTDGQITINGEPLDEHNVRGWQKQIAHVSQHIFLSDASILENVAFGIPREKIDHGRVLHACQEAELEEMIAGLPEGLNTTIGERGVRLSGGQRQRIGIARALYKQASILVLDEATSALDDATEAGIMDSIRKLGRSYTVLMIAHRTTTLRDCDRVYRMEHGRITQAGSFAEVVKAVHPTALAS